MIPFVIRPHLSESTFAKSLALYGVVSADETPSVVGEITWRWEDEPDMKPESLGQAVAGHSLRVPIDLKGRPIVLSVISKTEDGQKSVANITEAQQIVFTPSTAPVLADLTFDSGPDEVEGTIAENGGTGTIRILRSLEDDEFFEIDTVPSGTPSFIDSPTLDGTYSYKLTQDGQSGESNTLSVEVTGVSGGGGSPPTLLGGTYDEGLFETNLSWTNNGGTGDNIIEQRIGSLGTWVEVDSVSSATTVADIPVTPGSQNQTYYYRVRNESVAGYSNQISVYVPRDPS